MVIIMQAGAPEAEVEAVIAAVERAGFQPFVNPGVERKVIAKATLWYTRGQGWHWKK